MLRLFAILGAITLAAGACGTSDSDDERAAGVYAAVLRAVADAGPDFDPDGGYDDRVIYAGPLDDDIKIAAGVQELVVNELREADFATVRFVDKPGEAVRDDEDLEPVLEDGVLVLLSEIPDDGESPEVDTRRYVNRDTVSHYTAYAAEDDDGWAVASLEPATP